MKKFTIKVRVIGYSRKRKLRNLDSLHKFLLLRLYSAWLLIGLNIYSYLSIFYTLSYDVDLFSVAFSFADHAF